MAPSLTLLHTEASLGWGGQEIRILREAEGMREKGHQVIIAAAPGATLLEKARAKGVPTYAIPFQWKTLTSSLRALKKVIRHHQVDLINTHSSLDGWIAGIAGRLYGVPLLRTRHISAPIKKGWNSHLVYRGLADTVVTTCETVAQTIRTQAKRSSDQCQSIPTGVDPSLFSPSKEEIQQFKDSIQWQPGEILAGTCCVLRSWKGIFEILRAAKALEHLPQLKWVIIGSGPSEHLFREEWEKLGLQDRVHFTGHLDNPFPALAALDLFLLLSTGNEGVSQASLQAALFSKPLITTRVGGLPEVCLHQQTGYTVDTHAPQQVADAVEKLLHSPQTRQAFGKAAREKVLETFTFSQTLSQMETMYQRTLFAKSNLFPV